MKFQSIEVDAFGILANASFSDVDGGLNVIYGTNGSGKTTLLHFLRGLFCGFSESCRSGLLPLDGDRAGGGSVRVNWHEDDCRLTRIGQPDASDRLRVSLIQDGRETTHPRFDARGIRADLVRRLYTAGGAEGHTLDDLVQQAMNDGIPFVSEPSDSEPLDRAAADIHRECSELIEGTGAGRIAELADQRQRLQAELHRLTDQLRRRCDAWEPEPMPRLTAGLADTQASVTWLRCELDAAQSDLREAEDRVWSHRPNVRILPRSTRAAAHGQFRPPSLGHIDVRRIPLLKQLDRRIDHGRSLLAEAARARFELSLRAARIEGSDDTPTGPFLRQMRDSLASLEVGVLELRDNIDTLREQRGQDTRACDQWESQTHEAVRELSRRIYTLCEQLSRFELNHEKSVVAEATATIDECERTLRTHLDSLRAQRRAMLDASAGLRAWSSGGRAKVEQDQCHCFEHDLRSDSVPAARPVQRDSVAPATAPRYDNADNARPSHGDLDRLRRRRDGLHEELETALVEWRKMRNRRPPAHFPADIQALERQFDEMRIELAAVEASLAEGEHRRRVLSIAGEAIRRVVERLQRDRQPMVMQWASRDFARVTAGCFVEVHFDSSDHRLAVIDAEGRSRPLSRLSRGTLGQLGLCLRLALVRAYAARGIRFPLVLDDVLIETDQQRLRAAVDLLHEFARQQDQQIIYLSCQSHLAELFERRSVPVLAMPGSTRLSYRQAIGIEEPAGAIRGWVDRKSGNAVVPAEPTTIERPVPPESDDAAPAPADAESQSIRLLKPLKRRQPDGPYWLSFDAPVELVPSIGSQMGRRLCGLGIATAGDLIDLDSADLSLRLAALQITPERLRTWQAEAELLCCVPDLAGMDGQLLALCGISDADELSQADLHQLMRQIGELSRVDRLRFGETNTPNRDEVGRWILNSRRARSLHEARRFSRSRRRTTRGRRTSAAMKRRRDRSTVGRAGQPSRTSRHRRGPGDRSRLRRAAQVSDRRSESRAAMIKPFVSARPQTSLEQDAAELRFYLSPESLVVEAPSIGPTTSKRLEKIGVLTVADLLNRDAADIAARLKNRRMNEQTVLLWQQQARLMCRIPELRGHDAQVLIACGIAEPEQLANMAPSDLFALVGPFVATKEGQRLLRSSNTPDLEEVARWIHSAGHSRHLRAA